MVIETHSIPPQTHTIARHRDFWSLPKAPYDLRAFILADTRATPNHRKWNEIEAVLRPAIQSVWQNKKSAKSARTETASMVNSILAEK